MDIPQSFVSTEQSLVQHRTLPNQVDVMVFQRKCLDYHEVDGGDSRYNPPFPTNFGEALE